MADNVDYSLPQWLNRPTDTTTPLMHGMALGAQIQQERARLQQQAQIAQMEAQARSQEAQQRAVREQQEIAMQQARLDAERGLREQELAQHQQHLQLAVDQAQRQVSAHMRYKQMVDSGVDPAKALLDVGPDLGISMTGAAQLYKETQPRPPVAPPGVEEYGGKKFVRFTQPNGTIHMQQIHQTPDEQVGDVTSRRVLDTEGNPLKDMIAVPAANGGTHVMRLISKRTQLAQTRLNQLLRDPIIGSYLIADREPERLNTDKKGQYEARLSQYKKVKDEYDKLKGIVDDAMDENTAVADTGGEVTRRILSGTGQGKMGVFDARTKRFLRYAD